MRSGGGLAARMMVGNRVAFVRGGGPSAAQENGTYQEYVIVDAMTAVTIDKKLDFEQVCCSFVNPLSAIGLLDTLKQDKAKIVV